MNRRARRPLCIAFLLLSGCALLSPQQGASTKAMLSKLPASVPHERQHGESLLILPPQAGEAFDTTRMAYTVRPYQLAYFRDNEWAEPPTQMIQTLLVQTLEATGFFRSVLTPPETTHNLYTLDTAILNLVQDYTAKAPVFRLALRIQLLGRNGQPVANSDIAVQESMREATPYAGVVAANDAVAKALQQTAAMVVRKLR